MRSTAQLGTFSRRGDHNPPLVRWGPCIPTGVGLIARRTGGCDTPGCGGLRQFAAGRATVTRRVSGAGCVRPSAYTGGAMFAQEHCPAFYVPEEMARGDLIREGVRWLA